MIKISRKLLLFLFGNMLITALPCNAMEKKLDLSSDIFSEKQCKTTSLGKRKLDETKKNDNEFLLPPNKKQKINKTDTKTNVLEVVIEAIENDDDKKIKLIFKENHDLDIATTTDYKFTGCKFFKPPKDYIFFEKCSFLHIAALHQADKSAKFFIIKKDIPRNMEDKNGLTFKQYASIVGGHGANFVVGQGWFRNFLIKKIGKIIKDDDVKKFKEEIKNYREDYYLFRIINGFFCWNSLCWAENGYTKGFLNLINFVVVNRSLKILEELVQNFERYDKHLFGLDFTDLYGRTPMYYCVYYNYIDVAKRLIELCKEKVDGGASTDNLYFWYKDCLKKLFKEDNSGLTPLQFARMLGRTEFIELLFEKP